MSKTLSSTDSNNAFLFDAGFKQIMNKTNINTKVNKCQNKMHVNILYSLAKNCCFNLKNRLKSIFF